MSVASACTSYKVAQAAPTVWSRLRERVAWRHPEWWSIALSVIAWCLLLAQSGSWIAVQHSLNHQRSDDLQRWGAIGADTAAWLLMVVAMMLPLVVGSIRTTAERSLWRRRDRAIGTFLLGYATCWMLVGVGVINLTAPIRVSAAGDSAGLAAAGFAVAAAWQLIPLRRRALRACQRTVPLSPAGWRASADCFQFGWRIGVRCVTTCWALMLACTLAGHSVPAMVCAAMVMAADRYGARASGGVSLAILCGVAIVYAAVASVAAPT